MLEPRFFKDDTWFKCLDIKKGVTELIIVNYSNGNSYSFPNCWRSQEEYCFPSFLLGSFPVGIWTSTKIWIWNYSPSDFEFRISRYLEHYGMNPMLSLFSPLKKEQENILWDIPVFSDTISVMPNKKSAH